MDGTIVGLEHSVVIDTLKLYGEYTREMFEEILYCWDIENEIKPASQDSL